MIFPEIQDLNVSYYNSTELLLFNSYLQMLSHTRGQCYKTFMILIYHFTKLREYKFGNLLIRKYDIIFEQCYKQSTNFCLL